MEKQLYRGPTANPILESEPIRVKTSLVADQRLTARVVSDLSEEDAQTPGRVTLSLRIPGKESDKEEGGRGVQIIDLAEEDEEDDEDEEDFDKDLEEELEDEELDDDLEVEREDEEEEAEFAYRAVSPALTSGDLAADWKRAEVTGEETPGGTVVTPDQDRVDQIGRAAGVVYTADEPLDFAEKIGQRDRERWELDPDSVEPDTGEWDKETNKAKDHRRAEADRARS
jgi:hypothetical protein